MEESALRRLLRPDLGETQNGLGCFLHHLHRDPLTLTHEKLPNEKSRDEHEKGWMFILEKPGDVVAG